MRFFVFTVFTVGVGIGLAGAAVPVSSAPAASQAATAPGAVQNVQLVNTNASDAARLVNAVLSPAKPGAQAAAKGIATFDARTNTVVLNGAPELMARAVDLLKKIDQIADAPATSTFFIYHPTRAQATELADAMNRLLGRPGVAPGAAPGTPAASTTTSAASQPAAGSPGAAQGNVAFFVANPDTNSVLVTTDTQFEETVRGLLKVLDRDLPAPATASQSRPGLP